MLNTVGIRNVWRYLRRNTSLKESLDRLLRTKIKAGYPAMSQEDREYLTEIFHSDYAALCGLIGR